MTHDRSLLASAMLLGVASACSASAWFAPMPGGKSLAWLGSVATIGAFGIACRRLGEATARREAAPVASGPAPDPRPVAVEPAPKSVATLLSEAIDEARWADADRLVREHADAAELARALDDARTAAAGRIGEELAAARLVNDPARVIELRDDLKAVVTPEALKAIDADVVKWLMAAVMKRLRAGTVQKDVTALAATIADRFGHTSEGASLRASLPTLRRSAGLCPRCAGPYRGIAEACPACLNPPRPPATPMGPADDLPAG